MLYSVIHNHSRLRTLKVLFLIAVLIALVIDAMINQVADFLVTELTSNYGVISFIILCLVMSYGQYFVLMLVRKKSEESRFKENYFSKIRAGVIAVQISLIAITILLILEVVLFSLYHLIILMVVTLVSYSLNVILTSMLVQKLFSWYISNRSAKIILLYGLSFGLFAASSAMGLTEDLHILQTKQWEITPSSGVTFPSPEPGTLLGYLSNFYHYFSDAAFALLWFASLLLLYPKRHSLGRIKFFVIVALPLVYYLSTSVDIIGLYVPETDTELFFFYLYSSLNSTAGAVLFGMVFWLIARKLHYANTIRNYMIITGLGFILLFLSSQSTLIASSYPPYGVASVSYYGFSAFLILLGLYFTAISISQDSRIRQEIRRSVEAQAKMLDSIGLAQLTKEIEAKTTEITKSLSDEIEAETGVRSSLDSEDLKMYLEGVLKELGKGQTKK